MDVYGKVLEQLRSFARSHRRKTMRSKSLKNACMSDALVPHTLLVVRSRQEDMLLWLTDKSVIIFFFEFACVLGFQTHESAPIG